MGLSWSTCCRKMMVDRTTSVSISSFLVSATLLSMINTEVTEAQKIPDSMLDDILGDIASQYQDTDYGSFDYNDMVPENPPPMYKATAEPRSLKQTHNSKGPMKNSMLPAYCDPPTPCPIGYTAEDGCIEMFENSSEFSRGYQSRQKCICDTEHMFDCPEENAHRGADDIAAVNILAEVPGLVPDENNPYLGGQKLPVAAKKGNF